MNVKRIVVVCCSLAAAGLLVWWIVAGSSVAALSDCETWDVSYMGDTRIGYERTTVRRIRRDGRPLVQIEQTTHLIVVRQGNRNEQEIRVASIETPDGKLLEFQSKTSGATASLQTTGRVAGDRLELETSTRGKRKSTSIPWLAEYGGPYAAEASLLRRPMQPGEQRTIRALDATVSQVVTYRLAAKQYEPVALLEGTAELLRIDGVLRFPDGQSILLIVWSDRQGGILKSRLEAGIAIEEFRTTKARALEETGLDGLDLVSGVAVEVDRPLPAAHHTKRARYRVELKDGDPTKQFVSGPSQRVERIGPHTAELTVYALRPGPPVGGPRSVPPRWDSGNPDAPEDPPDDDDRQPNNMIQSDDARIVAMAAKAAGDRTDRWEVAQALERYVEQLIAEVDFSQAFATAAEVAENPTGDCTEHAVLLAALARARSIPARVAVGLVYMQGRQAFGYHMWTEVHVQGRWIPLDATLGQGGIGAAHLKVTHSNLKDTSSLTSFLPIIKMIGRLKIEVLEVQ